MIRFRDVFVLLQIACFLLMTLGYPLGYVLQFGLCMVYICISITKRRKWSVILAAWQDAHRAVYEWYRRRQAPTYQTPEQRAEVRGIPLVQRPSKFEDQPQVMYPQEDKGRRK